MNRISFENHFLKLFVYYALPLMIIGFVIRTFSIINSFYYLVPVLLFIFLILAFYLKLYKEIDSIILFFILAFPVYSLFTSLWSLYPLISLQRSVYLIFIYVGILSAVILFNKYYPEKNIIFLIPANILIVSVSIFSLLFNMPANTWSGGNGLGFMGFSGHQNALAAALLFTLPGVIALGIEQWAKRNEYSSSKSNTSPIVLLLTSRFFRLASFILLLTANCLLLILTYSRAAILSLFAGFIVYLILTKTKKLLAITASAFVLILVLYFTIPFIHNQVSGVLNKDGGNILNRRTILWEPSLEAAKMGGIFGLGYGVSAPDIKTPLKTGSHYEDGRYIREKGNSVLAMIEETGYIGLLLFLLPVFYFIIKILKSPNSLITDHRSLITAALAAMLLHSQFEAWWVGVGSAAYPLYLMILFMTLFSFENHT